jgi:hypothetical protein
MSIRIETHAHGPIADDRIQSLINAGLTSGEAKSARRGLQMLRGEFHTHFRMPTEYYESRVGIDTEPGGYKLTDHGVIYGWWLEGVGSRNATTRFKGYSIFRRVAQALEPEAVRTIEDEIAIRIKGA